MGGPRCLGVTAGAIDLEAPDFAARDLAVGDDVACGIDDEGSLLCWGSTPWEDTDRVGAYRAVAIGDQAMCAITEDGTEVRCFGPAAALFDAPPTLGQDEYFIDLDVADLHACAMVGDSDHLDSFNVYDIRCWGAGVWDERVPALIDGGGVYTAEAGRWTFTRPIGQQLEALSTAPGVTCFAAEDVPGECFGTGAADWSPRTERWNTVDATALGRLQERQP